MEYNMVGMELYPVGMKAVFRIEGTEGKVEIPAAFKAETVRPVVASDQEIAYFQVRRIKRPHYVPAFLHPLYKEMQTLEQEITVLGAKITALHARKSLSVLMPKGLSAEEAVAFIDKTGDMESEAAVQTVKLEFLKINKQKELDILHNDFYSRLPQGVEDVIEVSASLKKGSQLLFEAYSPYAGFNLSHRMNAFMKEHRIEGVLSARAWQKTGLDYTGRVTFYTRQPEAIHYVPQIPTWKLDFIVDQAAGVVHRKRSQMEINAPGYEEEMAVAPEIMASEPVYVQESPINVSLGATARLVGDGTPVTVDLKKVNYENAAFEVRMSSRYGEKGYLIGFIEELTEPVLPGNALLYINHSFAGEISLSFKGRGEKLEIPFGVTPFITLCRKSDSTKNASAGWISSAGLIEEGYHLEVTNGGSEEARIVVTESLPYAVNDKITVDILRATPDYDENRENVMKWKFTLASGESKSIDIKYRIKYPSERRLNY